MPAVVNPVDPPDPSQYSRVLRRYDRDPRYPWRLASYDVNLQAKPVLMDGKVAATVFVPKGKEAAAKRATRLGWRDETEAFTRFVSGGSAAPTSPASVLPPGALVGEALRERLHALPWQAFLRLARRVLPTPVAVMDGKAGIAQSVVEHVGEQGLVVGEE